MSKLKYFNSSKIMSGSAHGSHAKNMAVLHETVSPDEKGMADVMSTLTYLARVGYGIHGMTDLEGNMAWAYNMGNAIFWHAGGVNTQAIGIEQVSDIPALIANKKISVKEAGAEWLKRDVQLRATAQLLAAWHNVDPKYHVLKTSNGLTPGVCAHWNVSQHFTASLGHTDCWPVNSKGYYPISKVIEYAKEYAAKNVRF